MYVNGACVYVLCFQYRTDCLQHLPLQVREWCMCLHALLSVQDRLNGCAGVKRVDYTDGEISTVSVSPVCHRALQLHQVISPCERCYWLSCIPTTPGHLVQDGPEGKDAREHSSTLSVFIPQSSKRRLPLHASYCCMRFTCFPFSTANVNKSLSCTRKQHLPLRGASNNTQVSRIHRYSNKTLD